MKKILFLLLMMMQLLLAQNADITHINIGNQDFMLTTETYDEYDSKGEVLRAYKEERNYDLKFMFSLILKDRTGTCSDKSLEDGYYEINGSTVTLYSHWSRRGKAYDAPYGARIQVFKIDKNFDLTKVSSRLYIETQRPNYNENSGMKYLFTAPKNEKQKALLDTYVYRVRRKYNGEFIYGEDAKKLIKEVENAMTRKMKAIWN